MKLPIWKLEPGLEAPDFELPATGTTAGKSASPCRIRLSDHRGKQNVLLVFYPAAFTPT